MKSKQTTLNAFLQLSSDSEPDIESEYHPTPQKSALKVPDQWTRVKSLHQMIHDSNRVFDIEKDLDADRVLKQVRKGAVREQGAILFDPDAWKGRDEELKMDKCKLSEDELRTYAKVATEIRQKLKVSAESSWENDRGNRP